MKGSEGGRLEERVDLPLPAPSQAFLGDERAHHDAGHQGHPRQQPLLETLLRPPALCRRVLPKDFSKALLADVRKKGRRRGKERVNTGVLAADCVTLFKSDTPHTHFPKTQLLQKNP